MWNRGAALLRPCEEELGEVDFGFGFDDEEGVGVGIAGVAEFLAGFVEGVGFDGEEDFAFGAADEIEAALLLDELEMWWHASRVIARVAANLCV